MVGCPSKSRYDRGRVPADQRGEVQLGRQRHRGEDADHGEPATTQPDLCLRTGGADAEPFGGGRAEHHRRIAGGGRVEPGTAGHARPDGVEQFQVRRPDTDATGLGGRDPIAAVHIRVGQLRRSRRPAGPGRSGRSSPPTPPATGRRRRRGLARRDGEQVGAERGERAGPVRPATRTRCRPPRSSRRCRWRCPARRGTPAVAGYAARRRRPGGRHAVAAGPAPTWLVGSAPVCVWKMSVSPGPSHGNADLGPNSRVGDSG